MDALQISKTNDGGTYHLDLQGYIDERAELLPMSDFDGAEKVVFSFENVKHINSPGVLNWVKWMREFEDKGVSIVFEKCQKIVIQQINRVKGFMPESADVVSLYVPYFNDDTGESASILLLRGQHYHPKSDTADFMVDLPDVPSDEGEFEPDIIVKSYFGFLMK